MKPNIANFNPDKYRHQLLPLIQAICAQNNWNNKSLAKLLKKHPKKSGLFSKPEIIIGYQYFVRQHQFALGFDQFKARVLKKPIRTQSGVTPVTVLTKPYPCPGECIFCPSDVRMPKSYVATEPGAQRAQNNAFDPYLQTYHRLLTYAQNGHSVAKVELIILGGTWSYYPKPYQIWFIKRCFDALNDFSTGNDNRNQVKTGSDFSHLTDYLSGLDLKNNYNQTISQILRDSGVGERFLNSWEKATWVDLEAVQKQNETASCRCVGLVIETRPDNISQTEVRNIRRLGCTKTQIGFQSLQDNVLKLNKRGHDLAATARAMELLRLAGFKIHAHWMPNLYGSSPKKDVQDYQKIFTDPAFKPDELKIYPTALIQSAELMQYYQSGKWHPYTYDQLLQVLSSCIKNTPQYCRLTRIVRDFPSPEIVAGNKKTNFRQITEQELAKQGIQSQDIRAREIKNRQIQIDQLKLDIIEYDTTVTQEKFLQFTTPDNHIAGFLRLSLPIVKNYIEELKDSAIIREIHVYGQAADIGEKSTQKTQHLGLGAKLIQQAITISKDASFKNLAVISAVGTREYYRHQGFTDGTLYQHYHLNS